MVRSRDEGWRWRPAGVRTAWRVVGDGEFFCPSCGGDRSYHLLEGRRRWTFLGVPLASRGPAGPVVSCADCGDRVAPEALQAPTATRLTVLLRDAVHTVALALLAAGGAQSQAAREAAVRGLRAAGFPDCTEERLLTLLAALTSNTGDQTGDEQAMDVEVRDALAPLAPHLSAPGREGLLLQGARVALADGPYSAAERAVLDTIGAALRLRPDDVERLLAAARAPSS